MRASRSLLVASLALAPARAAADDGAAGDDTEARLTVPHRRVVVHALLEVSLSKDAAFAPVSVAPDVWYGVTPAITVGLVHSSRGLGGFLGGAGDGLCLTGEDNGCGGFYDRAGLLARYHVAGGKLALALDGGLVARSLSPFAASLKLGGAARLQLGKVALELTPNLWLGLTERDSGNTELLNLPLSATYMITPKVALAGQAGFILPLADIRHDVVVAASVGAQALVTDDLFVDVVFSLPHWLDTDRSTYGLDARTLTLGAGRAF